MTLFRRAIKGNENKLVREIDVESGLWMELLAPGVLTEDQLELCQNEVFCSLIFRLCCILVF